MREMARREGRVGMMMWVLGMVVALLLLLLWWCSMRVMMTTQTAKASRRIETTIDTCRSK